MLLLPLYDIAAQAFTFFDNYLLLVVFSWSFFINLFVFIDPNLKSVSSVKTTFSKYVSLLASHQSSLSFLCLLESTLTSIRSVDRYPWDFKYSQMIWLLPFSPFSVNFSSISLRVSLSLVLTIFRISSFTCLPIEGTGLSLSFRC